MKKIPEQNGFTLVETLVAIGVLVLAITGAFTAAQSGLSSYINSKNQAIAINLAQEAVEYIRATRDTNKINNSNWLSGIESSAGGPCVFGTNCILSVVSSSENRSCGLSQCPVLKQDSSTGYYQYTTGNNTVFRRDVLLTDINSGKEVSVLVTVSWNRGVITKIYKTREYLFNW
jgi:prepilin-type N-terminal cleavage/methylation domain-containing protein